jgi:hypothetical protein
MRLLRNRRIGSLFGDVGALAEAIGLAREAGDVTVWLNATTDIVCSDVGSAPDLSAEYLLGTYGVSMQVADIQQDLLVFRAERCMGAIVF